MKKKPTTRLDELQEQFNDIDLSPLTGAFDCAQECETESDFWANVEDALDQLEILKTELKKLQEEA